MEIISNIIYNILLIFILYIIYIQINNAQKNTSNKTHTECNIIKNNTFTLSNTLFKHMDTSKYSTYLEIQNENIYMILFNKETFNKQLVRFDIKANSIDWIGGKNIKTIQLNNNRNVLYHEKDVLNKGFQLHTTQNISKNTFKNNFYLNVPYLQKYIDGNSVLSCFDLKPNTIKLLYITKTNTKSINYSILHYEETVPHIIHVSNDITQCKSLQDNWYIDTIEKTVNLYNIKTCFSYDLESFLCTSIYQKKRIVFLYDFSTKKKICRIDQNINSINIIKAINVNNISGWICSEKKNNLTNSYKILYYFKKDNQINLSTYSNPHFISHLEVTGEFVIFTEVTTSMISNLKIYKLDSKQNLVYVKMISIGSYIVKDLLVDNKNEATHCTQLKINVLLNNKDEYKVNVYGIKEKIKELFDNKITGDSHYKKKIYTSQNINDTDENNPDKKYKWSSAEVYKTTEKSNEDPKEKNNCDCNPCEVLEKVMTNNSKQIYKCTGIYNTQKKQTECDCEILVTDAETYPTDFKNLKQNHNWGEDNQDIVIFPRSDLKDIVGTKTYTDLPHPLKCEGEWTYLECEQNNSKTLE
jgi:hypothetical protein